MISSAAPPFAIIAEMNRRVSAKAKSRGELRVTIWASCANAAEEPVGALLDVDVTPPRSTH
jgi:hypothetical protein